VICSHCGESTALDPCPGCGESPILEGRYRLEAVIGQGGSGVTYRATRLTDGHPVCVKELAFRALRSFEAERLFRREAAVLRQLDHPQIPAYLDDFGAGAGRSLALYLVQELVDGRSLADEMDDHRYTEREVFGVVDEVLELLEYLHGLAPPVVHRDLKPSNVMRRVSDGRLVLIDLGSVKDTVANSVSGSATVAGTFGYMAPEQLYGTATPASDLYAVGVIAVVLLSRREPAELLDREQQLDWRRHVHASPRTLHLLDRLTCRAPDERPASATEARGLLRVALDDDDAAPDAVVDEDVAQLFVDEAPEPAASRARPAHAPTPVERFELSEPSPSAPVASPSSKAGLVVAAASLFVGLLVLLMFTQGGEAPSATSEKAQAAGCGDGGCEALSTPYLSDLRFGMSIAEVREARRELASTTLERVDRGDLVPIATLDVAGELMVTRDEMTAKLLVQNEPATCTFAFLDERGLVRITCETELATSDDADTYEERVQDAFSQRYGEPSETPSAAWDRTYRWTSSDAQLIVSRPGFGSSSTVRVEQRTNAWDEAHAGAVRAARLKDELETRKREEARRAALDAERARLKALNADAAP